MFRKIIFFALLITLESWGAPCCGTTANNPSLITGDDSFQITSTFSAAQVVAEASVKGEIKERSQSDSEQSQLFRLDVATLLSDRLQLGLTLPMQRRARVRGAGSADSMGLGDVSASLAYELIPEWSYSLAIPKIFLFTGGILPTGGSLYDAKELYVVDSRGRGFYGLSVGALILKSWGNFDLSLLIEGHHFFPKEKSTELGNVKFTSGLGNAQTFGLGWSPYGGALRLGLAISRSHEGAVNTTGIFEGQGQPVELWNSSLQAGYLISDDSSINLNFSDQTFLARSSNVALNRSLAFVFQKRWER